MKPRHRPLHPMIMRVFPAERCELCSLEAVAGKRLCLACSQMIDRLAAIVGSPVDIALDGDGQPGRAFDNERARKLYERSLDLDIFSVASPRK